MVVVVVVVEAVVEVVGTRGAPGESTLPKAFRNGARP